MSDYLGKDVFKLGFGLMRLPKLADGESNDIEQICEMVDMFLAAGGTYFDTAYVYGDGKSEEAVRKALVDRHPRESYQLCTKLCAWLQCHDEESAKQQFYTSLERTGAGYFDYYLLHALQRSNYKKYDEYHLWDFVAELKEKGLVKNWGFSFHADPELLDELLTAHPEVDFVQLQINYADWDNPGVASRQCWEICHKHNKPITIMEPVKGGALASLPEKADKILKEASPEMSAASWAIRYAASLDGIVTVLSGMSDTQQMKDNLSYMKDFEPLTDDEREVIKKVQDVLTEDKSIACTACRYCTGECPQNIAIPEIFAVRNDALANKPWDGGKRGYTIATANKGKAGDCIKCGQCESACPQHLPIMKLLEECAEAME